MNTGRSIPVRDALAKVQGTARYVDDLRMPGLLHARLVLSTCAHGRVVSIDTSLAEQASGVVKIYTWENTPDTCYNGAAPFDGQHFPCQERMFSPVVRFRGDRVAMVVADSAEQAARAARLIRVEYREMPVVLTPQEALAPGAVSLDPSGNLLGECRKSCGPEDPHELQYDRTLVSRIQVPPYHQGALENHGVVAAPDGSGGLCVWSPTQNIFSARMILAELLEMPQSAIRVIKPVMGGSFGSKLEIILEPLAAFAARDLNRPVKLNLTRRETMQATRVSYGMEAVLTSYIRQDRLVGLEIDLLADAGAYASSGEDFIWAMSGKPFRLYRIPGIYYRARSVLTNKPVASAMRGYGSTQLITALEIHMDRTARFLGEDPWRFRREYAMRPGDPDPLTGETAGSCGLPETMEKGLALHGETPGTRSEKDGWEYGTAMALGVHGNGMHPVHFDTTTMALKMNMDGSVNLITGTSDMGTGAATVFTQIAGEVLGIPAEGIGVAEGDTSACPFDLGCYASRSVFVAGRAAKKAAEDLKEQLIRGAGDLGYPEGGTPRDGSLWFPDGTRVSWRELAGRIFRELKRDLYSAATHTSGADPMSYAAHFATVRVHRESGRAELVDYTAVHDVGRVLNPGSLEGQIHGAVQMGAGMALSEDLGIDGQGRITRDSLGRYRMLAAPDLPEICTAFVESLEAEGPFGAKSIGEIACVPVPAAVINALSTALGEDISRLPFGHVREEKE